MRFRPSSSDQLSRVVSASGLDGRATRSKQRVKLRWLRVHSFAPTSRRDADERIVDLLAAVGPRNDERLESGRLTRDRNHQETLAILDDRKFDLQSVNR